MRNTCQKHKKEVDKYDGTINELADDISNLHYKSLEHLLDRLSGKLFLDSMEDTKGGRDKLAKVLNEASKEIGKARKSIEEAWIISKPYM